MTTLPAPPPDTSDSRDTWLRLAVIRLQDTLHACSNAGVSAPELRDAMARLQRALEENV